MNLCKIVDKEDAVNYNQCINVIEINPSDIDKYLWEVARKYDRKRF